MWWWGGGGGWRGVASGDEVAGWTANVGKCWRRFAGLPMGAKCWRSCAGRCSDPNSQKRHWDSGCSQCCPEKRGGPNSGPIIFSLRSNNNPCSTAATARKVYLREDLRLGDKINVKLHCSLLPPPPLPTIAFKPIQYLSARLHPFLQLPWPGRCTCGRTWAWGRCGSSSGDATSGRAPCRSTLPKPRGGSSGTSCSSWRTCSW